VDHGKSTLVRALTGMEPDRWAEERRRGMTIDLGYAWTALPATGEVAFVDVPGHQRFITNMLAGVGPVPAVLLVVAADEGWRRQTGEHLAALEALGVRHGVLAVTRSDLADPSAAIGQARAELAGTGLAGVEAVPVSAVTGTGLDALRSALDGVLAQLPVPTSSATRLWVDRVFAVRGAGTVVTGTLSSGRIAVGDRLTVPSTGQQVVVRGLEALKQRATEVTATARVAVNLRGVATTELARGDALVAEGRWAPVTVMDVRLSTGAAKLPAQLVLHAGSAATAVRVRPLGAGAARLSWRVPLPLHVGDRVILRDPGSQTVVAGAVVLDVHPPELARRGAAARRAAELTTMSGTPDAAGEVVRRGLVQRSALVSAGVSEPGAPPPPGAVAAAGWLVDRPRWQHWQHELGRQADGWAREHPMQPGLPRARAVQALGLPVELLDELVRGAGLVSDASGVRRPETGPTLPGPVRQSLEAVRARLAGQPFAAPESRELAAAGLSERHLATAVSRGELLRLAGGVYLLPDAPERAVAVLGRLPQPFTLSAARQALGTTRRVAVPLLELLDRLGLTEADHDHQRTVRTQRG
jgi:selenocysteine-specific elongation factor